MIIIIIIRENDRSYLTKLAMNNNGYSKLVILVIYGNGKQGERLDIPRDTVRIIKLKPLP